MKSYRTPFRIAVVLNVVLVAGLVVFWRVSARRHAPAAADSHAAQSSAAATPEAPAKAPRPPETPLVPVQLSAQRLQSIGVRTGVVAYTELAQEIRASGTVQVDETRLAYVQLRFPGWIRDVYANATYQFLRKGQPLFTIYSPSLVTTEREYLLARKNRDSLGASSVPGVSLGAASLLEAATERLKQWNVPQSEIERLEKTGEVREYLTVESPVSGFILDRQALPNMYVQPETRLYTVADLSRVWVFAEVFQSEVGALKTGDLASLTVDAYPGRTFTGRIDFIYPQVDMTTRTVRVRLVFANPRLVLKPGMFMNVRLCISLGRQLAVPSSAIFQSGTRQVVFVDHGDGYLEPREVEVGPRAGDQVGVRKGLKAGERVITSANFLIDSESQLQAALGAFVPPPPGAGAAAGMKARAGANAELTTEPSPPRKGANIVRVKLTDADGKPLPGAQVRVTFFMPAMPAMGMAAMRVPASLSESSPGLYEGSVRLEIGGTWQVTLVAQKDGQTIASKQLSLSATGGM